MADVRLSWATDPKEMHITLQDMLELSKRVGCQVYDGQIDKFITPENIDEIMKYFNKKSASAIGLIGKIDRD